MLIDKKINDLQNLTKQKITYDDIAKIFNVSRSAIQNRISRKQQLKPWEEQKLDEFFLAKSSNHNQNSIKAEYFPDFPVTFKNGKLEFSSNKKIIYIPFDCFQEPFSPLENYFVINAEGNSMEPEIYDKDKLIVRHFKDYEQIIDNKVYFFSFENQVFIKRLIKNINQLIILSDNKVQKGLEPVILKDKEIKKIGIIGQIYGLMRDCR